MNQDLSVFITPGGARYRLRFDRGRRSLFYRYQILHNPI